MMCCITGTPGTGKSRIAEELARRGHTVVHLSDTIRPYVTGEDEDRETELVDVERWIDEFVPVNGFVEGHFVHLLPCDRIIVLRCRPDELKKRLAERKYPERKIHENIEAEALDVCLVETVEEHEASHIYELDTTGQNAASCADQIERFVKGELPARFGFLDWTSYLEPGP